MTLIRRTRGLGRECLGALACVFVLVACGDAESTTGVTANEQDGSEMGDAAALDPGPSGSAKPDSRDPSKPETGGDDEPQASAMAQNASDAAKADLATGIASNADAGTTATDAGVPLDAGPRSQSGHDAGHTDPGQTDAGPMDAGGSPPIPACQADGDWACGGDLTGRWEVVGVCGDLGVLGRNSRQGYYAQFGQCPELTTSGAGDTCGTLTFGADQTITPAFWVTMLFTDTAPKTCLSPPLACDESETEAEITDLGDACRIRWGDSKHYSGTTAFAYEDRYVTFDDPKAIEMPGGAIYCVAGDVLHFGLPLDQAGTRFMVFVARRIPSSHQVVCEEDTEPPPPDGPSG